MTPKEAKLKLVAAIGRELRVAADKWCDEWCEARAKKLDGDQGDAAVENLAGRIREWSKVNLPPWHIVAVENLKEMESNLTSGTWLCQPDSSPEP